MAFLVTFLSVCEVYRLEALHWVGVGERGSMVYTCDAGFHCLYQGVQIAFY